MPENTPLRRVSNLRKVFGGIFVTGTRIGSAFLVNKVLAVHLGPAGFALVGQFQNILLAGQATSSFSLQNGWVSLTARFKHQPSILPQIWAAGLRLTAWASAFFTVAMLLVAIFAPLEHLLPGVEAGQARFAILLAIPGVLGITLIILCQSVANGLGRHKLWETLTLIAAFSQGLWVVLFVLAGYPVLPVIATQSFIAALIALILLKRRGFSLVYIFQPTQGSRDWMQYAVMGIVPMLFSPLTQTIVRTSIGSQLGWDVAGLWQGAWRISDFFNVGLSSLLGAILLPQFAAKQTREELFDKIRRSFLWVISISGLVALVMVLLRVPLVRFVLSEDFLPVAQYLPWQLAGDVLRSGAWVLGLALLSQQALRIFMVVELLSMLLFTGVAVVGISYFGTLAPFLAYVVENGAYLIVSILAMRTLNWGRH